MTQPDSDNKTSAPDAAADGTEYLEYKGDPTYGTEFLVSHTITPAQAKNAGWESIPDKDMVWERRESGKHKGRMLIPMSEVTPGVADELVTDPAYRVVKLK